MDDITFITLDPVADLERVTDLVRRASDYVAMETGGMDFAAFVQANMNEAPPVCGPEDIFRRGLERPDGTLAGFANSIRHYPEQGHWYMGLLLLDPAERGKGLGALAASKVLEEARADGAPCIRIAVLDANAKGRKFWAKMGYVHERTVPGDPDGDGHMRHVLKQDLKGA